MTIRCLGKEPAFLPEKRRPDSRKGWKLNSQHGLWLSNDYHIHSGRTKLFRRDHFLPKAVFSCPGHPLITALADRFALHKYAYTIQQLQLLCAKECLSSGRISCLITTG